MRISCEILAAHLRKDGTVMFHKTQTSDGFYEFYVNNCSWMWLYATYQTSDLDVYVSFCPDIFQNDHLLSDFESSKFQTGEIFVSPSVAELGMKEKKLKVTFLTTVCWKLLFTLFCGAFSDWSDLFHQKWDFIAYFWLNFSFIGFFLSFVFLSILFRRYQKVIDFFWRH